MTRLFVYGSLGRGGANHREMSGARFEGVAVTAPGFAVERLGRWPAMVRAATGAVEGEVFEVDDELLVDLDRFEGVPSLYTRATIELEDGSFAEAYLRA